MKKLIFQSNAITDEKLTGCDFTFEQYSKFKFGSKTEARFFGKQLATRYYNSILWKYVKETPDLEIVVYPSPYGFVPTATNAMKDYFIRFLNEKIVFAGGLPVYECKIHRSTTYRVDYGKMSAEERIKLIGNDIFHIDKDFAKNKLLIFMDDVRITGTHEKMIDTMCETNEIHCLYFANLLNQNIGPQFEDVLNHSFVRTLADLNWIIRNDKFAFNTRVIKFILGSEHNEAATFLHYQNENFLSTLLHLAMGNRYNAIEEYKENFNYLLQLTKQ